jgi:hypothetical protein
MSANFLVCRRCLVVEDEVPTAQRLQYELEQAFPGIHVELVHTVKGALRKLDESVDSGTHYDVAIVDFKLPMEHIGENPVIDFSVARQFGMFSPDTILVHITAFADDPEILRYHERISQLEEAGHLFIAKEGRDWYAPLRERLVRSLHVRRIRRRYLGLFGRRADSYPPRSAGAAGPADRCDRERSLAVAELYADASQHWEYLNEQLRNQLRDAVGYAQDEKGHHLLGVIEADISGSDIPMQEDE